MAGVQTQIRVSGDKVLERAFARALGLGVALPPIHKDLGEANLIETRGRFRAERDPEGRSWAPLNPEYRRTKRGRKILQGLGMRGGLLGSIAWQLVPEGVAVGTNKIYARPHQLGATIYPKHARFLRFALGGRRVQASKVTIPARPFLGMSAAGRTEAVEIVNDHVRRRIEDGR